MIRKLYKKLGEPDSVIVIDEATKRMVWSGYVHKENISEGATHNWGLWFETEEKEYIKSGYVLDHEIRIDNDKWLKRQIPIVQELWRDSNTI